MNDFNSFLEGISTIVAEGEERTDQIIKTSIQNLKAIAKRAKVANLSIKKETLTPESALKSRLTRKAVKEHNESVTDPSQIIHVGLDITEVLKSVRKQKREERLKNKSINSTVASTSSFLESTRDYTTPEFDPLALEAKRKEIYEQLEKSVTKRKPIKRYVEASDSDGTPVKTKATSSITSNSPTTNQQLPIRRRLANALKYPSKPKIITLDNIETDDESEIKEYPSWTKHAQGLSRIVAHVNPQVIDTFFCSKQVSNIDTNDLFPNTPAAAFKRRRSSLWT